MPEVIAVGADHQRRRGRIGAAQHADEVAGGLGADLEGDRELHRRRPGGAQASPDLAGDDHHRQAGVGGAPHGEIGQRGLGRCRITVVDDDQRRGAALTGGGDLGLERGRHREVRIVADVGRREPVHHHDPALDRATLVVVPARPLARRHQAPAGGGHLAADRRRRRHRQRAEGGGVDRHAVDHQAGVGADADGGGDVERLHEASVGQARGHARGAQLALDQRRRLGVAGGAGEAPLEAVVGQGGDGRGDAIGGGGRRRARVGGRHRVLDPLGDEHVGVGLADRAPGHAVGRRLDPGRQVAPVGAERQPAAVGREHREAVEALGVGDALEAAAVGADRVDVELAAARVG
ncbi:MAG: hypothetical protein R2939_07525 [Kofleriaceae bacterium]